MIVFFASPSLSKAAMTAPELRVHVAHASMVAVDERALLLLVQRAGLRDVRILAQLAPRRRGKTRRALRRGTEGGERGAPPGHRDPNIFSARQKGRCGLRKTDRHKKRRTTFLRRVQAADRLVGDDAVGIRAVRHVRGFIGGTAREIVRGLIRKERLLARQALFRAARGQLVGDALRRKMRHAPRRRIFVVAVANVKDFSHRLGPIPSVLESLRQRHRIGPRERGNSCRDRRCRGSADAGRSSANCARGAQTAWLQKRVVEAHAARGEPVDVRRLDGGVAVHSRASASGRPPR